MHNNINMSEKNINIENLSNAEIRIKMKTLENEFTSIQNEVSNLLHKMSMLDSQYIELQNLLNKRTKGVI